MRDNADEKIHGATNPQGERLFAAATESMIGTNTTPETVLLENNIFKIDKVSLQRHNHKSQQKTEPTYTKTSLFQEKGGVFFVARFGKGVVLT